MAEASQQYCCHGSGWNADSKKHNNSGKEVRVPAEGTECRFKVCEWQAGGSDV